MHHQKQARNRKDILIKSSNLGESSWLSSPEAKVLHRGLLAFLTTSCKHEEQLMILAELFQATVSKSPGAHYLDITFDPFCQVT